MPTFSVLDDIVLKPPVSKTKAAALEDEIVRGGGGVQNKSCRSACLSEYGSGR